MKLEFKVNHPLSKEQFVSILTSSELGNAELLEDETFIQGILDNTNVIVTAWDGETVIGVARSITDFHCVCYLSELAVDKAYQEYGVGRQLQSLTKQQLGPKCKLILIATDGSNEYYKKVGFQNNPRCWILEGDASME